MVTQIIFLALAILTQVKGQLSPQNPTPVPILREINTHNKDGSYTYGYESGDGSYKVETKSPTGEVKGKYGYYDDLGQLREIEYGATNNGFVSSGSGIAPELSQQALLASQTAENFRRQNGQLTGSNAEDDGQYRPEIYEAPYAYTTDQEQLPATSIQGQNFQGFPLTRQQFPRERVARRHHQRQNIQPAFVPSYDNQYSLPQHQQRQNAYASPLASAVFQGHPASNINLNSGTYSINY